MRQFLFLKSQLYWVLFDILALWRMNDGIVELLCEELRGMMAHTAVLLHPLFQNWSSLLARESDARSHSARR